MEMFGYASVEGALAKVFGMPPAVQAGMLRGRLIHLRRLGLAPKGSGRGKRIEYDRDAAYRWLIALKLEDVGVDPLVAINLIEGTWEHHLVTIITAANKAKDDVFLGIDYPVLRAAWDTPVIPKISHFRAHESQKLMKWLSDDRHVCVFNLSACLRILNQEMMRA
jgi:hypothetical protein